MSERYNDNKSSIPSGERGKVFSIGFLKTKQRHAELVSASFPYQKDKLRFRNKFGMTDLIRYEADLFGKIKNLTNVNFLGRPFLSLALTLLAFLLAFSLPLTAQTSEELFQKGNELYRAGKFAEAIPFYEKVMANHEESGALYFNLGNAYYKTSDYAHAILNFERAKKFMPNDEAVNVNLQLANLYVTDNVDPMPKLFYWQVWDTVKSMFSINQLGWFVVWFFLLLLISVGMFLFTGNFLLKRLFLIFSAVFLVLVVFSAGILAGAVSEGTSLEYAVVLSDVVNVKTTPDDNSGDAFVIHKGVKIRLLDTVGEWREVKLSDGKVGWLKEKEFEEI